MVALAAALLVVLVGLVTLGAPGSPSFQLTIASKGQPQRHGQTQKPKPQPPCPSNQPGPVVFYANQAQYNDFGPPLVAGESALQPAHGPQPSLADVLKTTWTQLCHDWARAKAITAVQFPTWSGLHGPFDWQEALNLLAGGQWSKAWLKWYDTPPGPWTMGMVPTRGPPTTFMSATGYAGWYLEVPFAGSPTLVLRIECGDQPVFGQSTYQMLQAMFPTY